MKIVLPYKDRGNYLRIALATIREACRGHKDIEIMMYDDGSVGKSPDLIDDMNNVHVIKRNKCIGPYQSKAVAISDTFAKFKDEPYLLTLDSDCIVHPNIISVVHQMVADLPDMGMGSVFNTKKHQFDRKLIKGKYVLKKDIGGLGTIIRRDVWDWYNEMTTKHGPKHKGWDWDMTLWLNTQKKWRQYSTLSSYVDHIGQSGSHSGPDCPIDRAYRFLD